MRWQVLSYPASTDRSVIDDWCDRVSRQERSKFEQRIRFLRDRAPHEWIYDYAHALKDARDIFEVKFEAKRIAHRPLCCFGPTKVQFTILMFAVEHNKNLRPPDAIQTAENLRASVMSGALELFEYDPD